MMQVRLDPLWRGVMPPIYRTSGIPGSHDIQSPTSIGRGVIVGVEVDV